ncbi:mucin-15-like isoform X2 [Xyrauchen texanus]|nr:mucin-15-like isoform X2 [Xyrauchen texanus]
MKWPLGIILTLTFLLTLQNIQQVSTQIPDEWERSNGTILEGDYGEQPASEDIAEVPMEGSEGDPQSNEATYTEHTNSESSSEKGQSFGYLLYSGSGQLEQRSSKIEQIPSATQGLPVNDAVEVTSYGPIATTPPLMIPLNSSFELSDTSAEFNEIQNELAASNTSTSVSEQMNETAPDNTYPSSNPYSTTTQSSLDEPGSQSLLPEADPANSTTKSLTSTTTDGKKRTTVRPSEPPVYKTTKPMIQPDVPEDITTAAPDSDNTDTNLTGLFDSRGNSERGFSSDVTEQKEKKGQGWAIVLGIGIVVGVIALAAFIIINQRNRRDFSHRQLMEEMSPDPVLRLDNSEPLDLKYDGFGYYNPGLQGGNIQMTNFPQGSSN